MIKAIILFVFFFLNVHASDFNLQTGDVVLMSYNCYECRVIESETESSFSHSGVVLVDSNKNTFIYQALGTVRKSTLQEFLSKKTPNTKVAILRPIEFLNSNNIKRTDSFELIFKEKFQGLFFDPQYLWDNKDKNNREFLYCSEFVAKFLDIFLSDKTKTFSLSYKKNYDYWYKYFKGNIPEGVEGNSPAAFLHDPRFIYLGDLNE